MDSEKRAYLRTILYTIYKNICFVLLVWFDTLRPSQQFFSYVGTGLPGLNLLSKDKCILLKDTTQWWRWDSNQWPLSLESSTLPLTHCSPYICFVCVKETSPWDVSFTHTILMFDRERNWFFFFRGGGGGDYIFFMSTSLLFKLFKLLNKIHST